MNEFIWILTGYMTSLIQTLNLQILFEAGTDIVKLSSSRLAQFSQTELSLKSDYFYPQPPPPTQDSSDLAWNNQFGTL